MKKYTTHKLSPATVRHAKPKDKLYRLRDGGGLSCDILTTGRKVWRYAYRIHNKQKTFTIGAYPEIGLSDARIKRDEAKEKVKAGIDPSLEKQIAKVAIKENSFQAIAESWLEHKKNEWSGATHDRTKSYLVRDVYPWLGKRDISIISTSEIILVIKKISERGANDAAKRVKGNIQQIYDYAVVHNKAERNTARDINIQLILPKTIKKHYAAITDPVKLGELLRAINEYQGSIVVRLALKLAPMVMLRPSELGNGEWVEIDFDNKAWTVPARRRKLPTHLKKANKPEHAHTIPLSSQMIIILKELQRYTGKGKFIFPSARGNSQPMSNNALRVALRIMGFTNEEITPHGFRGVASSFLNTLGYRPDVIEAQLAHKDKNEIRSAYNHADYMEERKIMLQEWCDYLDTLREGATVIPFKRQA